MEKKYDIFQAQKAIVTQYESIGIDHNLGMHASATDLIYYARIARKHGQLSSALVMVQCSKCSFLYTMATSQ